VRKMDPVSAQAELWSTVDVPSEGVVLPRVGTPLGPIESHSGVCDRSGTEPGNVKY
jgi:hypothetical protein